MIEFVDYFCNFLRFQLLNQLEQMAFNSVKNLIATVAEASPAQFDDWQKTWRSTVDAGSAEPLLTFVARERGVAEDVFVQRLAASLGWPYLDLPKLSIATEARNKLSTKIAFQYSVLPTALSGEEILCRSS